MDQSMPSASGRIAYKQLEKVLEDLLLSFQRQDIQKLKSVMDLTQHSTLVQIDLSTIYDFIQKQAFQFYNLTKWGLENHMEELESDFLNIIFIISCISLDTTAEDQEEEVELPLFYEELNASFSTSEVSCSFETEKHTQKEVDISEKISIIIMKNPHKLVDLIKLLFLKKRLADISALETLVHRGLGSSENHGLELASVFAKAKNFQEATYTFNNVKEVARGIPQFIDVMIANCMVTEDNPQPLETQKLKEVESFAETADEGTHFNSIKMIIHLGITFFTKNNYVKAYHYYQKAWKLYKSFPETCYQFALTLFHLQMFDEAFAVLENRDISMTTAIHRAIDINLLGDIQGFRGNYEKAEEHFQMSFNLFCYGYQQNRTFIDYMIFEQQNLSLAVGSVDDIYKNFFSKAINDFRYFQNVQKKRLDKEIRNIRISKIIKLFRDYIEKSGSKYPEPFIYMVKLHLLNKRPDEAKETYLLLLSIMLQKQKRIRPQFFLSFFLQMKTIPLFLVEQRVIRDTDDLIERLSKEINFKIKQNFAMGVQYFEMGQFDTAKIAFHEVKKLENYKQKVDLQLFHFYVLSCYRHLELRELGVQYIQREVDTLIIMTAVPFLLEYYCRALNSKQIKELFQKIRIEQCNRCSYLQFIRMMISKGLGKDIKEQLDILEQQLQQESDSSIQLCELGQLYYEVKDYSKALFFLKKGLTKKDKDQLPNQFYLARVLTILNSESASFSEEEEHIIQQLQLTKTNNSDFLTEIGKFYLRKQRLIDAHSCFERAFSFSLNQTTYQHYFESCLTLKKEETALQCIKTYIQRLMEELQFQESSTQFVKKFVDPTEKAQYYLTCKHLCDLCKKMADISPSSLGSLMEKGMTLRSVYHDVLKKYAVSIFERERLPNDKYIAELIDLSTQQGKHEETLSYIENLIEKYPRYPSFLKIKEFCIKKCHDQWNRKESICPKCQQIILKNQQISLISQLFLITEMQDKEESALAFKKWFEELQRCLKQGKRGGFPFGKKDLIDMCPILTFAEAKNKEKSSFLVIYKGMLQLLFNKSVASKIYTNDLKCFRENGNESEDESFNQWFSSFLKLLKTMGMHCQIFLLNFIYYFGKTGSQQRKMLIQKQIRCFLGDQILEKLKSVSFLQ